MEIIIIFIKPFIGSASLAIESFVAVSAAAAEITSGRARALAAVAVGIVSVILAGLAWARGRNAGTARFGAIGALVLGVIGAIVSAVHITGSTGFGTGGGRAGAIVALVLSLAGVVLGSAKIVGIPQPKQGQPIN